MTKQDIKRAAKLATLKALKYTAFAIGLVAEILYKGGRIVYGLAADLYRWTEIKLRPPEPPRVVKIPVRQLGLKTGQQVFIRRVVPKKIEVKYVRGQ